MKKTALILSILAGLLFWQNTFAQTTRNTQNSVDYGSRSGLTVDPITQALQLQIPLGSYPQRNGGLPVTLFYSSKLWRVGEPHRLSGCPLLEYYDRSTARYGEDSKAGWTSTLDWNMFSNTPSLESYNGDRQASWNNIVGKIARMTITLPDGSRHELRKDDSLHGADEIIGGKFYATDGSRLVYDKDAGILYAPDGSRYEGDSLGGIVYKDENGNQINYGTSQITDTLGRTLNRPLAPATAVGDGTGQTVQSTTYTYSMPGISGNPVGYQFVWKKLSEAGVISEQEADQTLRYKGNAVSDCNAPSTDPALFHSDAGQNQMGQQWQFNPVVLNQIILPNGQTYTFKYNIYGEISKIIYPTGAYERFSYSQILGISGWFNNSFNEQTNRGVTNRWISSDGTVQSELLYNYSSTALNVRSVQSPDGTRTEYSFYTKPNNPQEVIAHGFDNPLYGKIYEERQYAADGTTLLRRKLTEWAVDGNAEYYPLSQVAYKTRNPRVTREISIQFETGATAALAQLSEISYDTNADAAYFATLNPKQTKTYHYVALDLTTATNATLATIANSFSAANLAASTETDYLYSESYKARNMTSLAIASRVKDAGNTIKAQSEIAYDEPAYWLINAGTASQWQDPNTVYRGNVTTTKSWSDIVADQFVQTHAQYDNFGNLRKSWDAKDKLSEVEYSATYNYAYPTKTISPVPSDGVSGSLTPFETTTSYDFNTGKPTSATDANGQISTIEYNDPLLRPTKTIAPNGHQTITEYGAGTTAATRFVKVKTQIDATKWKEGYSWYDGVGRTIKSQSVDTSGDVFTETEYDNMGRAKKATNPYRTGETKLWTENFYDSLGRVTKVKTPDLAEVNTSYSLATTGGQFGEVETVTDEAGKLNRSITDALDNLIRVDEPNDAGQLGTIDNPNQATIYNYDTRENLTHIVQGGQTRNFVYDSLNKLKQATNPESGTFQYVYDSNGNLTSKTDARNVSTTFTYDALNRVILRDYSDATPDVAYFYDNPSVQFSKGELTKVSSSVSQTEYTAFDALGRTLAHKQTTDGTAYTTAYSYNLSGALISETYPSGRVVKNVLDANGDLSIVQSKKNSTAGFWNYAEHFSYTAADAISSMQLGNGKWESTQFNSRLQPTQIALGTVQNGTDTLKLDYSYNTPNVADNSGNVKSQTITVPTVGTNQGFTATQNYTYDSVNRLKSAAETISGNQSWKQTFVYDRFGNRNFDAANTTTLGSCQAAVCNPAVDAANNRFTTAQGYQYDLSGNIITDAQGRSFTYDAENKQKEVRDAQNQVIGQYFYDGDGRRVKKLSTTETVIFVYDTEGKLVAEYANQLSPTPQVSYLTTDALGSPRIKTDANGNVISRNDYLPFGEDLYTAQRTLGVGYKPDDIRRKFTTYKRDAETDLDFAEARYYSSKWGRFVSPDEFTGGPDELFDFADDASDNPTFYADLENPQSLNKYQYTYNNPLNLTDSTGHCPKCEQPKLAIVGPLAGAVVAAVVWIFSNPQTIGPRQRQTTGEALGDIIGGLPGGRGAGGVMGGIINKVLKGGTEEVLSQAPKAVKNVVANKIKGDAFRDKVAKGAIKGNKNIQKEITVKTKSGTRTRVDVIGTRNGKPRLIEAKASQKAPLTKNQAKAFPEIQKSGAVVVGKGRPGYPRGTVIPPQKVRIIRGND